MAQPGEARAMVDTMLDLLARIQASETTKRHLVLGSPEFVHEAVEVERLSRIALQWARLQLHTAEGASARLTEGSLDPVRLDDVEPRRSDRLVTDLREAEVRLEVSPAGSPEEREATEDTIRLRDELSRTTEDQ
jgi:hypothetical protein